MQDATIVQPNCTYAALGGTAWPQRTVTVDACLWAVTRVTVRPHLEFSIRLHSTLQSKLRISRLRLRLDNTLRLNIKLNLSLNIRLDLGLKNTLLRRTCFLPPAGFPSSGEMFVFWRQPKNLGATFGGGGNSGLGCIHRFKKKTVSIHRFLR